MIVRACQRVREPAGLIPLSPRMPYVSNVLEKLAYAKVVHDYASSSLLVHQFGCTTVAQDVVVNNVLAKVACANNIHDYVCLLAVL